MTRTTIAYVEGMLRRGKSVGFTSHASGWGLDEVIQVARRIDVCPHEACGLPQTGPGHPRSGWVRIHQAGRGAGTDSHRWFCSWRCAHRHVARQLAQEATA